jgi:hypothetical protein
METAGIIRKLYRKAESTPHPEEAALLHMRDAGKLARRVQHPKHRRGGHRATIAARGVLTRGR